MEPCKQEVKIALFDSNITGIKSDVAEIKDDMKELLSSLNNGLKGDVKENQASIRWLTWAVRVLVAGLIGGTFWVTRA